MKIVDEYFGCDVFSTSALSWNFKHLITHLYMFYFTLLTSQKQ